MSRVVLIVIYNHQYNENIDILERVYRNRFSKIFHLVPFYEGKKNNVIPVYENSHYFQGFISQSLRSIYSNKYDHYLFIADDLILNPLVSEDNYTSHFYLDEDTNFIPEFINLHDRKEYWARIGEAFRWSIAVNGIEAVNQIPSHEEAVALFTKFNLLIEPLHFSQIWKKPRSAREFFNLVIRDKEYFKGLINLGRNSYFLPYPLVGGYSDIFVISAKNVEKFAHYCGVFAATRLFVEIALPTSVALSAKKVVTEIDLELRGQALWTNDDHRILDRYDNDLSKLLNDFPADRLYLHPIKLSKWETTL